jgi:hypothetical protein
MCHISVSRMAYLLVDPVMIDFSGERCAASVRSLSTMSRPQLEAHLETVARASASIVMVRLRQKAEKLPRTRRHQLRRDRWR